MIVETRTPGPPMPCVKCGSEEGLYRKQRASGEVVCWPRCPVKPKSYLEKLTAMADECGLTWDEVSSLTLVEFGLILDNVRREKASRG